MKCPPFLFSRPKQLNPSLFSHSLHPNISRSGRKYSVKLHVVFQMSRNPGKRDLYEYQHFPVFLFQNTVNRRCPLYELFQTRSIVLQMKCPCEITLRHISKTSLCSHSKKETCYSRTSPYGRLYNTDTSLLRTVRLVPEMPKILHSLPLQYGHLCKADTWFCPSGVRIKEV